MSEYCSWLGFATIPLFLLLLMWSEQPLSSRAGTSERLILQIVCTDIVLPASSLYISAMISSSAIPAVELFCRNYSPADIWLTISACQYMQPIVSRLFAKNQLSDVEKDAMLSTRIALTIILIIFCGILNFTWALPIVLLATPCFLIVDYCRTSSWAAVSLIGGCATSPLAIGIIMYYSRTSEFLDDLIMTQVEVRN